MHKHSMRWYHHFSHQGQMQLVVTGLTLLAICVGSTACTSVETATTLTIGSPIALASAAWTPIPTPVVAAQVADISASPVDPQIVLLCSSSLPTTNDSTQTFMLWQTHDSGTHWTKLVTPPLQGHYCRVMIARDAPDRILLMIYAIPPASRPCTKLMFLSTDGGNTWQQREYIAPTPANSSEVYCDVYPTAHHL